MHADLAAWKSEQSLNVPQQHGDLVGNSVLALKVRQLIF